MRIGVISEGHADRAVITNILIGLLGIDESDIEPLRPIYALDETDKALRADPRTFGSWSSVKEECEKRELIDGFLAIEGQDFIVIHIDTAEASEYGITRPDKRENNYCEELRALIIAQINTWLEIDISNHILYAIAVEEIDAWILTIYEKTDSTKTAKPKERLGRVLSKSGKNSTSNYENYFSISKPLSKPKDIKKGKYLTYNCSLNAFFEEIHTKVLSKIMG
ncbi:hypothetical protein QNI19_03075 [Cytophagaceae bacterium DM2B3-1]|uniref:DUF4276 family protein n=1 Tax=Xanthocytophaga flava TaxID=3048013 RepID=A0ABT7CDT6_9BACT|nr:hypothetical protein [Xanthocytophaga flavus]MDJ1472719.1 hypothetical protein [Xanthocytophaga flavus]MDJ1491899.1 hypothetical protein [Xanthocytophaga flavus]